MAESNTPKKRGRPATGRKTEAEARAALIKSEAENLPQFGGPPDDMTVQLLREGLSLLASSPVDVMDPDAVRARTMQYIQRCVDLHRRPAIAAYAMYLGLNRSTLKSYVDGSSRAIHPDSLAVVKSVYSIVDASMEQQMTDGEMNVVAGIFLMRNNLNYTNVDTVEIVPKTPETNRMDIEDVINEYTSPGENA